MRASEASALVLALGLLGSPACGTRGEADARGAAVAAILAEFPRARDAFVEGHRAASRAGTTKEYLDAHRSPDAREYARRLWPLVESKPDDATGFLALRWIAANSVEGRERALGMLAAHHLQDPGLVELLAELGRRDTSAPVVDFLARCLAESRARDVRAHACFALAQAKHELALAIGRARSAHLDRPARNGEPRAMSPQEGARLVALDLAGVLDESARLFERAGGEFGDVAVEGRKLADTVGPFLHEVRHLEVGCEAPDIVGEDVDGVALKLSDHRGKVVLLNFWGFW